MIAGQNKNKYLVLMAMYLVQCGYVDVIKFQYMLPGHSFLPCDQGFGVIEKAIKLKQRICCPEDYARIAGKGKRAVVEQLKQEHVLTWKALATVCTIRTPPHPYLFSKARSVTVSRFHPFIYKMESSDGKPHVVSFKKAGEKRMLSDCGDLLTPKYPENRAIRLADKKVKDLKDFRLYLHERGQKWADETIRRQMEAVPRPRTGGQLEEFDEDNLQDEDVLEDVDFPEPDVLEPHE